MSKCERGSLKRRIWFQNSADHMDCKKKQSKNPRQEGPRMTLVNYIDQGMTVEEAIEAVYKQWEGRYDKKTIKSWLNEQKESNRGREEDDSR